MLLKSLFHYEIQKVEKLEELQRQLQLCKSLPKTEDPVRDIFHLKQHTLRKEILELEVEAIETNRKETERLYLAAKRREETSET